LTADTEETRFKLEVDRKYSEAASTSSETSCCGGGDRYSNEIPKGAKNGSLGCGCPVDYLQFQPGMTIADLGCGSGVDAFAAANKLKKIGGKVVGIDSTIKMIARARRTASENGYENVLFKLGEIEDLPLADESIDAVISNCAINLVPDKSLAFSEIFRVLKLGRVVTISDIVARNKIPDRIRKDPAKWSECISGALSIDELRQIATETGFSDFRILEQAKWDKTEDNELDLASITFYAKKSS